jgi:hypothetical protein
MIYNPSMREEPRHRPAGVLPKPQNESILDWLERNGRIAARVPEVSITYDEEIEELNEIIGEDGGFYDDEDDLITEDDEDVI